jgi:hypothetical protein
MARAQCYAAVDFGPAKGERKALMATQGTTEIEREFAQLSPEAQLTLLEKLVHRVRLSVSGDRNWDAQLSVMADDPEMKRELRQIGDEFRDTEADGLGRG